ncbi:unnamed protein product [Psylliodes chrysocephalus]|uniref:Myb/SANT-like DNA-binding domain-containing protein n=1 Tax=Psylliodes chrysocephalus TaxID=3402493 RepID=A0A9P0DAE0_9CUCU|nr:unnamed protein product [Psylliodes chrysocephala]
MSHQTRDETNQFLNEFLNFEKKDEESFFTREKILYLLNLHKINKTKVESGNLKNMKVLWEVVARDISNKYRVTVMPHKCENKFKVLERNYKKTKDNNNKTGRGRRTFEFEREFDELYGKKQQI